MCRSDLIDSNSIDKITSSLSHDYVDYQNKYYPESFPKRFDTNNYSIEKFKNLAKDTRSDNIKYTRVSIDEARAVVQAELENVVVNPTRPTKLEARQIDLDYKVDGPDPLTYVDIKNPVGSEILAKQGQTTNVEDMAFKMGQKIVQQKKRFVGLKDAENVGHIVDLCYVPNHEKALVQDNILRGARDMGNDAGIIF